jgi:hypothetical protein
MQNNKLWLLSMLIVAVTSVTTFPKDIEVVLPKNWKGYIDDTAKIYVATPAIGCFDESRRFPRTNWKGLFVYANNSSFIEDIELEIVQLHSVNGHSRTQIRYSGMPTGPCDTTCKCPIFFIANLQTNADSKERVSPATSYIDRSGKSKLTYNTVTLDGVKYTVFIEFDKKLQRVQLMTEKYSQVLYVDPLGFKTELVWAGDVNEDKRLDLLFSRSDKESATTYELWLSYSDTLPLVKLMDVFAYCACR